MFDFKYQLARLFNSKEYQVFSKLPFVSGWPENIRRDSWGNRVIFEHYGNTNIDTGWEIDHIRPISKGGSNDLNNLQALQHRFNRFKSNSNLYQLIIRLANQQNNTYKLFT